jgi:hypothetical protein
MPPRVTVRARWAGRSKIARTIDRVSRGFTSGYPEIMLDAATVYLNQNTYRLTTLFKWWGNHRLGEENARAAASTVRDQVTQTFDLARPTKKDLRFARKARTLTIPGAEWGGRHVVTASVRGICIVCNLRNYRIRCLRSVGPGRAAHSHGRRYAKDFIANSTVRHSAM